MPAVWAEHDEDGERNERKCEDIKVAKIDDLHFAENDIKEDNDEDQNANEKSIAEINYPFYIAVNITYLDITFVIFPSLPLIPTSSFLANPTLPKTFI